MIKRKDSIYDFLLMHSKKNAVSFHMPGHKGAAFYKKYGFENFLLDFLNMDITEIPGADNLFQAEGIIKECAKRYAQLYNARKAYLLINGTSGGIIASILATVPKGGQLIMARNSHKSVFNALNLGDIRPVYAYPELNETYGISGSIIPHEIEKLLVENPEAYAVILPSPNYYGICSDISAIAKIVHDHDKILIVDEAHGAHLHFMNKGLSALDCGADIVINSIHKTLASMTQSAVLNVNKNYVADLDYLEDKLQIIESTSPSYILLSSLDICASILENHSEQLFKDWTFNLKCLYETLSKVEGLEFISDFTKEGENLFDFTKVNFSFRQLGISGLDLEEILIKEYNIFTELVAGDLVMAMSGMGNTEEDFEKLADALLKISDQFRKAGILDSSKNHRDKKSENNLLAYRPELKSIPTKKIKLPLAQCDGKVCALSIIPYPPGIPIVCPGEVLTAPLLQYIKSLRDHGEKVIGITEDGEIYVGQ